MVPRRLLVLSIPQLPSSKKTSIYCCRRWERSSAVPPFLASSSISPWSCKNKPSSSFLLLSLGLLFLGHFSAGNGGPRRILQVAGKGDFGRGTSPWLIGLDSFSFYFFFLYFLFFFLSEPIDRNGRTPFHATSSYGLTPCVWEMLKDSSESGRASR